MPSSCCLVSACRRWSSSVRGMAWKVVVFLGSVRDGRQVDKLVPFVTQALENRNFEVTVFDPLKMEFPMLKKPLHFHMPEETPPNWLVKYNKILEEADAYVVLSGEYNRCIPPALTSMMDYFPGTTYKYKPCGIICYSMGSGGGISAGMQLRAFLGELGMVTPQFILTIPMIHQTFSPEGEPLEARYKTGIVKLTTELEWYTECLKRQRDEKGLPE